MNELPTAPGEPQYLSHTASLEFLGMPIGTQRLLSKFEAANLDILGLTREEAAELTPEALEERANAIAQSSDLFIGS